MKLRAMLYEAGARTMNNKGDEMKVMKFYPAVGELFKCIPTHYDKQLKRYMERYDTQKIVISKRLFIPLFETSVRISLLRKNDTQKSQKPKLQKYNFIFPVNQGVATTGPWGTRPHGYKFIGTWPPMKS